MKPLFIRNLAVEHLLSNSELKSFSSLPEKDRNKIRQYLKDGMSKGLNPQNIT